MVDIKITKGLDIPIEGQPVGPIQHLHRPERVALDLKSFDDVLLKLLVKQGDTVKIGQPLVLDKKYPERQFVSPGSGIVTDIRRGHRRQLTDIVIQLNDKDEYHEHSPLKASGATREQILNVLLAGGLFAQIRQRPFNTLADPTKTPRSIFVKALESAPLTPSVELQIEGHEREFAAGLEALSKLTSGSVHLVYRQGSTSRVFADTLPVVKHTANGPHPVANQSLHIQEIDPIQKPEDVVWTVTAWDVVAIGHFLLHGKPLIHRVISIAGPGVLKDKLGYYKARLGHPISALTVGRVPRGYFRLISGDPLTGKKVEATDFLGFAHNTFTVIPEATAREFLHFFRLGLNKYSASGCYLSGHLKNSERLYPFTTSQHGEQRAFITNTPYDKVMPLDVSTMLLCKAVMAGDYELADQLGLLTVDAEDFALPTFVCPSKIEMTSLISQGLRTYAQDVLK